MSTVTKDVPTTHKAPPDDGKRICHLHEAVARGPNRYMRRLCDGKDFPVKSYKGHSTKDCDKRGHWTCVVCKDLKGN